MGGRMKLYVRGFLLCAACLLVYAAKEVLAVARATGRGRAAARPVYRLMPTEQCTAGFRQIVNRTECSTAGREVGVLHGSTSARMTDAYYMATGCVWTPQSLALYTPSTDGDILTGPESKLCANRLLAKAPACSWSSQSSPHVHRTRRLTLAVRVRTPALATRWVQPYACAIDFTRYACAH